MGFLWNKKRVCALDLKLPLFLPMCGQWMYRQIKGQDGEERWSDFRRERIDRASGESRMNDKERTWEINGLRINVAPNENEMKWVLSKEWEIDKESETGATCCRARERRRRQSCSGVVWGRSWSLSLPSPTGHSGNTGACDTPAPRTWRSTHLTQTPGLDWTNPEAHNQTQKGGG